MEELEFRKKYEGRESVKNIDEFTKLLNEATADANDYGSIVVCYALMMNAAFSLVNSHPSGGITGFQASCLMWEMVQKYGGYQKGAPLRIMDYTNLLYPQYSKKFGSISPDTWNWAQNKAKEELERIGERAHPNVLAHMKSVANGKVPFGLRVEED